MEEYQADEDNWDRALEHGYAVVNKEVRDRYGTPDYEDDEDEDEEEDDDEVEVDDDVEASEGEEVETVAVGDDEDEEEDTEEADAASEGETDAVASKEGNSSGKSKKKVRKVEADVSTQVTRFLDILVIALYGQWCGHLGFVVTKPFLDNIGNAVMSSLCGTVVARRRSG